MGVNSNNINPSRIITIEKTEGKTSWRNNLSSLMSGRQDAAQFMFSNTGDDFTKYNVLDTIDLLMDAPPKAFGSNNDEPFSKPIEQALGAAEGIASGTKLGKITSAALNIGKYVTEGISALSNLNDNTTSKVWQPWTKGVIGWNGAKGGIQFSYTFNFRLGQYGLWNAKEEVVKPILNLLAPALPQYLNDFTMSGPFPNTMQLLANLSIGEAWKTLKGSDTEPTEDKQEENFKKLGGYLGYLVNEAYQSFTYTIKFGKVSIYEKMLITSGDCTFSNEVDQFGYPVSGSCTLQFTGVVPMSLSSSSAFNMGARFGIDLNNNNEINN